ASGSRKKQRSSPWSVETRTPKKTAIGASARSARISSRAAMVSTSAKAMPSRPRSWAMRIASAGSTEESDEWRVGTQRSMSTGTTVRSPFAYHRKPGDEIRPRFDSLRNGLESFPRPSVSDLRKCPPGEPPGSARGVLPLNRASARALVVALALESLVGACERDRPTFGPETRRSEEHTSELQSRENLVCRLLLEKKNTQ